jgi:DNA adenine methylase
MLALNVINKGVIVKYMGSKNRHAKDILPILREEFTEGMQYIEPFVGGGNMIDKVDFPVRIGCDISEDTINALISIRDHAEDLPRNSLEFTEQDYNSVRKGINHPHSGYISYALSYAGKHWGGWRRDGKGTRDYVKEAFNNAQKQSPSLKGVTLLVRSVFDIHPQTKSLIYCDPPYRGTTKYKVDFDHDRFYDWCRFIAKQGHTVIVSEYWMPEDFECVFEKSVKSSLTKDTGSLTATEKVYKLKY